jgi:hypothetical protein
MNNPCGAIGMQGSDETLEAQAEPRYRHRVAGSGSGCTTFLHTRIVPCQKHMTIIQIDDFSAKLPMASGLCNFL